MQEHITTSLKKYVRWIFLSFAPIVFCVGTGLIVYGFALSSEVTESKSWPMTPGRFIEGRVHQQTNNAGNNSRSYSYRVFVSYEYEVDSKLYQGSQIVLGQLSFDEKSEAQVMLDEISNSQPLPVYYAPEDPSRAVLNPGDASGVTELKIVGLCFIGFSLLWVLVVWLITK